LDNNTHNLDGIIVLIVFVASLLAIVVLFNLTSINISERTREIATLKVLGFRDSETSAYIYREAIILSIISIGIGICLGLVLHHLVIDIIETSVLSLWGRIEWSSYCLAAVLTLFFSAIMHVVTYFKLTKIDMIGSLKSVE
jgi:putative ABC transport system permease protein